MIPTAIATRAIASRPVAVPFATSAANSTTSVYVIAAATCTAF